MSFKLKFPLVALALVAGALVGTTTVAAQGYTFGWDPRTGDAWVDSQLDDINRYGSRYREPFVNEMVRYYGAPRDLVSELLDQRKWAPGDVYYACSIAQVLGRPCRYVVDQWDRDHGQGWGTLAQRLGIKPGSAEFHRLKRGFVPTYDRWARPIRIDDDLRRDFPEREKSRGNAAGKTAKARGNAAAGRAGNDDNGKPGGKAKGKGKGKNGNGKD